MTHLEPTPENIIRRLQVASSDGHTWPGRFLKRAKRGKFGEGVQKEALHWLKGLGYWPWETA
jgi:hypothetical protein